MRTFSTLPPSAGDSPLSAVPGESRPHKRLRHAVDEVRERADIFNFGRVRNADVPVEDETAVLVSRVLGSTEIELVKGGSKRLSENSAWRRRDHTLLRAYQQDTRVG
jgi:hypothetical protein